jgi:hypothetical protein
LRAERRVFWCICGDCYGLAFFSLPGQLRVHQAPGVPTPFEGETKNDTSREKKSRGEIADSYPTVIARSACDEDSMGSG